jgi:hypothetical protein
MASDNDFDFSTRSLRISFIPKCTYFNASFYTPNSSSYDIQLSLIYESCSNGKFDNVDEKIVDLFRSYLITMELDTQKPHSQNDSNSFYLSSKPFYKTMWFECEMNDSFQSRIAPYISQLKTGLVKGVFSINLSLEVQNLIRDSIKNKSPLQKLNIKSSNFSFSQIE